MGSPTSNENIKNIVTSLSCPVNLTPLTDAVTLFPCGENLCSEVALSMFKGVDAEGRSRVQNRCPVCQQIVKGYSLNHSLQSIVENSLKIFDFDNFTIKEMHGKDEVEKKPEPKEINLPYPGNASNFIYYDGEWRENWAKKRNVKSLEFRNIAKGALIDRFKIEKINNSFLFFMRFSMDNSAVRYYFQTHQIPLEQSREYNSYHIYIARKPNEQKTLFDIISKNCKLTDSYLELIKGIINKETAS